MEKKRKVYAPFSLTSEAGVGQTPVEGYIDVNQVIYPTVNTGTVNENGTWTGVKSDDAEFIGNTTHVAIADGGDTFNPDTSDLNKIDMTGFTNLFIAIKPDTGGNYGIRAVMGPDTNRFANLQPVNAGVTLRGNYDPRLATMDSALVDDTESLTAYEWNIFYIGNNRLQWQKNLNFRVRNNTGCIATFEVAFLRLV